MVELRSQIEPIFRFVQREVPGLEGAYLSGIAPLAGVQGRPAASGGPTG